MKKVNALVSGLAILLAMGCGGDEPEPGTNQHVLQSKRNCVVTHSYTYISGYSYEYTYDNNDRVTKAQRFSPVSYLNTHDLVTYTNNGKIRKIRSFDNNGDYTGYRIFEYSPDNLIKTETTFARVDPADSTTFEARWHYEYSYNSASQLTQLAYFVVGDQPVKPRALHTFSYQPDGSILMSRFNNTTNEMEYTAEYFFATNPPSVNQVQYFTLFNGLFNPGSNLLGYAHPVKISEKHFDANGAVHHQARSEYSYTYNPDGYPTEQLLTYPAQPTPLKSYWTYNCQ